MAQLKDRDLFDSLYRGYPCGFLLHWETGPATCSPKTQVSASHVRSIAMGASWLTIIPGSSRGC
jgi:hypothetical protein